MRILVTGVGGQLGYDVVQVGQANGFDMVGTSSKTLDITNKHQVDDAVQRLKPDAIIHCAAYTAVDQAEDDRQRCWQVNVEGTRYVAEAASRVGAKFVYISTDYVFDGAGTAPYVETDRPNPKGYYGLTKFEGEQVVKSLLEQWFIVRISWVFGMNGNNFVKTMLRLAETRDHLNVVSDQIGAPTYTADLAPLLLDMVQSERYGIYHATNQGECSWAEFARAIFALAGKSITVQDITSEEYPTRAIRPQNSRLSQTKLVENGFTPLPPWQNALSRFLETMDNRGEVNS